MESWGEKSWRQARIISYICPHFLQQMIDPANYPMLPSLSQATRGCRYDGNQRSLRCVPHRWWCYMIIHEAGVNGEAETSDPDRAVWMGLFWKAFKMIHVLLLFVQKMSTKEMWWAVPLQPNVSVVGKLWSKAPSEAWNISGRRFCSLTSSLHLSETPHKHKLSHSTTTRAVYGVTYPYFFILWFNFKKICLTLPFY